LGHASRSLRAGAGPRIAPGGSSEALQWERSGNDLGFAVTTSAQSAGKFIFRSSALKRGSAWSARKAGFHFTG
jgi:hypothetical protein